MKKIYFFYGLPASGKSTEALKMVAQDKNIKRVNKDSLRSMLGGSKPDFDIEKKVTIALQDHAITTLLSKNFDVVVDDTNLKEAYYTHICDLAKKIGDVQVIPRFFECSLKECLDRNEKRLNPVPTEVIHNMYEKYIKNGKLGKRDAVYFPSPKKDFTRNPQLNNAIIVDIDGTLALNESGRDYYDLSLVLEDKPFLPVVEIVRMEYLNGTKIIILSGRDDSALEDTTTWLMAHDIPYDFIHMRVTGDRRKDAIIKREIYDEKIHGSFNIKYIIDDRPQVIRMWRELGHTVFQVNDLEF